MNGFQNRKASDSEKPFPGCMGRMVNLFDLSPGMAANRLLTEKAHRDGSVVSRGRPDVKKRLVDPIGDQIEDKPVAYEMRRSSSNKKSNGTPMKMLIAQEMLKETESKHKPPSVVARLMGLDTLPAQQPVSTLERSLPEGYLRNSSAKSGSMTKYRQQENGFLDKQMRSEIHPTQAYTPEQREYKDVYEVWQQSSKINYIKDQPRHKGRYNENSNERKMDLVRQKFIEAKRLATDEKLRQSKEFQDALEVLSSNRDLFLKFLQEPNSLFSKHLYELQSIPPPPQTKRITVLKPSRTVESERCAGSETKYEKQIKKQDQVVGANRWDKSKPSWSSDFVDHKADNSSQPTRIVVLKPSPGKTLDIKAVGSSPTSSPRLPHGRESIDFYGESVTDEARGSREIAKEITRQMRESLSSNERDEALPSSVLLNGYVGDESSFNRSENGYIEEGNLSDSEIMTPTSRHSWDYINRNSSPYSSSSFSRASYSPESSVNREAKKRLSERWAMMASNGIRQEQRNVRRSSSTLGEMLARPEMKTVKSVEEGSDGGPNVSSSQSCRGEHEHTGATASLSSTGNRDESGVDSPGNLSRSRSVPVSSTVYEKVGLKVGVPDPKVSESVIPKEVGKPKSGKSSLKGKVSSLFFSRNKKPSKGKSAPSPSVGSQDESQSAVGEMPGILSETKQLSFDDVSQCVNNGGLEEGQLPNPGGSPCKISSPICLGPKQGTLSSEGGFSLMKSAAAPENSSENLDQPSPISILEAPFEDDVHTPQSAGNVQSEHRVNSSRIVFSPTGSPSHLRQLKSESTSKSILESVTCSLSLDDASLEIAKPNSVKHSKCSSNAEKDEQEWFLFVQTLLSAAGLGREKSDTVFARWHSSESPLDPTLLDKYMNPKEEEQQQNEAKRRQQRSDRRLLFDSVNAALTDMSKSSMDANPRARTCGKKVLSSGIPVTEEVWARVREWFSGEAKQFCGESENSLVVESVVRKEVVGKGWVEVMGLEVDEIGKEIERELLKGLIEEALAELTC
ncbi:uncharacterized protein LOC143860123 [Tasmannia lanceolata]|uniref:uncharacterized protein LOC143860123 n=1 Tax=Tasmannia lanceolata TaxID=3420 RepID=UPI004063E723